MVAEFTLSAWPVYAGGARGETLARVSGESASECLTAIGAEIERWLAHARHAGNGRQPRELELRLSWRAGEQGSGARVPAPPPRTGGVPPAALSGRRALRRRMECLTAAARSRPALRPDSPGAVVPPRFAAAEPGGH